MAGALTPDAASSGQTWRACLSTVVRVALTAVFISASVAKVRDVGSFRTSLAASMLVPQYLVSTIAWTIIALEVCLSIGLWIPGARLAALRLGAVLCSVFLGYSAWRALQAIPTPCHCFGRLFTMSPLQGVVLNTGLLASIAWLISAEPAPPDRLPTLERSAS
jgi:hypothetical protein